MRRIRLIPAMALAVALYGCSTLPPGADYPKRHSVAFAEPEQTALGRQFPEASRQHPEQSAFHIISAGIDGFAARIQLIKAAQRSLDLQYFIFTQDQTGSLISAALLSAADRGVHVRLLVDDGARKPGDARLQLLAAHPQIEVRVFNPFRYRGDSQTLKATDFLFEHGRLDFRMHNKLFLADNATALIGGRNIGDEYFQVDPNQQFADDDVLVAGPLVPQLSEKFDEYWNSVMAIPAEALAGGPLPQAKFLDLRRQLSQQWSQAESSDAEYMKRAASGNPLASMIDGSLPLVWAKAQLVCDSPLKKQVEDGSMVGRLMYEPVARTAAASKTEILMITPYFVPTSQEMELLGQLRTRGVAVQILTNSLSSNTELAAQAGYSHYRMQLLKMGVVLYELRTQLGNSRGSGQSRKMSQHGNYGLHAKLFVFDRKKIFIGSMNFDQRSSHLNTEIGLIIENADLGEQTAQRFQAMTQLANAYEVVLRANGAGAEHLVWRTQEDGHLVEYSREPSRSAWRRAAVKFVSYLPIDHEL